MVLVLVGASHHEVALEDIATLTAGSSGLPSRLVTPGGPINGAVLLATCNRVEFYLDTDRFHDAVELVVAELAWSSGRDAVGDLLDVRVGQAVVEHLFAVSCGLESMVVGESEIAGQVRAAIGAAAEAGTTTAMLQRLFDRAMSTSKTVATRTALGAAGRSIASVGLDLVQARHWPVAGRRALLVGTGSYARVVLAELGRRGCTDIWVYSPSGRSVQFTANHGAHPVGPDGLSDALARAELVITTSGSREPLISREMISRARFGLLDPLPILDLALTPDVEHGVADMALIDLIDLPGIGAHAPGEHASAILAAQDIVERAVATHEHLEGGRIADSAVVAMRAHVMRIIDSEVANARRRCGDEVAQEVARSLRRVSNALLHTPSIRARELAREGSIADYQNAMATLFGISVEAGAGE